MSHQHPPRTRSTKPDDKEIVSLKFQKYKGELANHDPIDRYLDGGMLGIKGAVVSHETDRYVILDVPKSESIRVQKEAEQAAMVMIRATPPAGVQGESARLNITDTSRTTQMEELDNLVARAQSQED